MIRPKPLFQLGAILAAIGFVTLYVVSVHDGYGRYYRLYYFLPVTVPVVLFIFDRLARLNELGAVLPFIDSTIALVSLIRAIWPIPFYSGHALFLSFILLTTKSKVCLAASALVLLQTIYLKIFLWDNDFSLYGGLILGSLLGVYYNYRLGQKSGSYLK